MMKWKTLNTDTLIHNRYLTVYKNKVQLPDGFIIEDYYTVTIPDAVSIVAITKEQQVLLKKEYRYACMEEMTELPAGVFDEGETDPLTVAQRELLEETGYVSDKWTYLAETRESTSKLTNKMHLFLAQDCKKVANQHLDATEHLEAYTVPFTEALQMVMQSKIKSNSSAQALLMAARMLNK